MILHEPGILNKSFKNVFLLQRIRSQKAIHNSYINIRIHITIKYTFSIFYKSLKGRGGWVRPGTESSSTLFPHLLSQPTTTAVTNTHQFQQH